MTGDVVEEDLCARANVEIGAAESEPGATRNGALARLHVAQVHGLLGVCAWRASQVSVGDGGGRKSPGEW